MNLETLMYYVMYHVLSIKHLKYTPQIFTVSKFWGHLEKVIILKVQRSKLLHLL